MTREQMVNFVPVVIMRKFNFKKRCVTTFAEQSLPANFYIPD